jgi:hypothetical protein
VSPDPLELLDLLVSLDLNDLKDLLDLPVLFDLNDLKGLKVILELLVIKVMLSLIKTSLQNN